MKEQQWNNDGKRGTEVYRETVSWQDIKGPWIEGKKKHTPQSQTES